MFYLIFNKYSPSDTNCRSSDEESECTIPSKCIRFLGLPYDDWKNQILDLYRIRGFCLRLYLESILKSSQSRDLEDERNAEHDSDRHYDPKWESEVSVPCEWLPFRREIKNWTLLPWECVYIIKTVIFLSLSAVFLIYIWNSHIFLNEKLQGTISSQVTMINTMRISYDNHKAN